MMTVLFVHKLVLWIYVALLGWAAISDTLRLIIPNRVSLGLLLLYPAQALTIGSGSDVAYAALIAAIVLLVGAGMFARGWLGGGDVKLMAVVALWAGPKLIVDFILVMTLSGAALAIALMTPMAALLPVYLTPETSGDGEVRRMRRNMPYGVAIAIAGLYVALHLVAS